MENIDSVSGTYEITREGTISESSPKAEVSEIMLRRREEAAGKTSAGPREFRDYVKYRVASFAEADEIIRDLAVTAPCDDPADLVDVRITWKNATVFEGVYRLRCSDADFQCHLQRHIRGWLRYLSGDYRPRSVSPEEYALFVNGNPGLREKAQSMLASNIISYGGNIETADISFRRTVPILTVPEAAGSVDSGAGPHVGEQIELDFGEEFSWRRPDNAPPDGAGVAVRVRQYSVRVNSLLHYPDTAFDFSIEGFPTFELAKEYARRFVRHQVEDSRAGGKKDAKVLWDYWWGNGTEAVVTGGPGDEKYSGSDELEFFIQNPIPAFECDYRAVLRMAGIPRQWFE